MKTIKIIGLITGIALMCFCSYAQDPIHYTVKDGLPSNHVYTATQDNEGFMWFGTNRGVAKFDGESFKVFTVQDGLPNNDIWFLHADGTGKVWYGSKSMYQGYIYNDRVYKFITEDSTLISPTRNHYYGSFPYYKSMKLIDGRFKYALSRNVSESKRHEEWNENSLNFIKHQHFIDPGRKKCYVIKEDTQFVFTDEFKLIEKNKLNLDIPKDFYFYKTLSYGAVNDYYYILHKNGLLILNLKDKISKFFRPNYFGLDYFTKGHLSVFKDLVYLQLDNRIFSVDSKISLLEIIYRDKVPQNISLMIFIDGNGAIWECSVENGATYHRDMNRFTKKQLNGEKVTLIGDIGGQRYYATNNSLYDSNLNIVNDVSSDNGFYKFYNGDNNYVISNRNIYKYNNGGFTLLKFSRLKQLLGSFDCKDILITNSRCYIASSGSLYITKDDDLEGEIYKIIENFGLMKIEEVNSIKYVGGALGLKIVEDSNIVDIKPNYQILKKPILSMKKYNDGLFVGTDGFGVYYYYENETFNVKGTQGLIVQDLIIKDDFLWLASHEGVKKVNIDSILYGKTKIVDAFYDADGIHQNNCNTIYVTDTSLIVGNDLGVSFLNLHNPNYKIKPILYFKNIADSMVYSAKEAESLVVNFGAIDFVNQKYLKYFYKIKPSESDWIEIKGKFLNFSHLEHGKYELIVRVVDQHNNENQKKAILVILPQWWETLIAKILIGIGLTFIAWAFFRYYANSNSEKIRLNLEMERKMGNLELLALRSQMNPHFVHNSLNSIQYFVQKKETSESEKYIASFSKLIRKIFELSRRQSLNLKEEVELITEYLEIESLRFEDKLTFAVNLDARINPIKTLIPSMILQPIIENAVNHGVFHKKEKGHISVSFNFVDALSYEVVIEDDGVGIHHTVKEKVITDLKGNRHSTSVLMERIELLKDNSEWDVSYSIIDLKKSTGNNGTRVTLIFNELDNEYI